MKKIFKIFREKKLFFYLFLFILFVFDFSVLNNFHGDNYFNYGFSYNIVHGMMPYRDFNLVVFPLSPLLIALILKIFGSKLIVYYLWNSLIAVIIIYMVNKLEKSVQYIIILILLIYPIGGYNFLSILLLFIIIYLERKKANDYLIGFIIGLSILNNQKLLLLIIPTLLSLNISKISKRAIGAIIPIQILLIYIYINNALYSFVDYTILGLFGFGSKNYSSNIIFLLIDIYMFIYLLFKYLKTKDSIIVYYILFLIITLPIVDDYHLALGLIPFVLCTCKSNGKTLKFMKTIFLIFIVLYLSRHFFTIYTDDNIYFNNDKNSNYFLTIGSKDVDKTNDIMFNYYYSKRDDYHIYFIYPHTYYYKLKNDIKIDKFDLVLTGNNGYNEDDKLQREIKAIDKALFIVYVVEDENKSFDQVNYKLIDFITKNYKKIADLDRGFSVYEIVN